MDTRIEIWLIIRADEWAKDQKGRAHCLREHYTLADCIRMFDEWAWGPYV